MDLTPLIPAGRQIVESYGGGGFRVSGRAWRGSILVFADRTKALVAIDLASLDAGALAEALEAGRSGALELLILGCGSRMATVPGELRQTLRDAGVVVEAMDTGAACRTYNVLMAEGRRVAAALIAVG
jgi:uncharacterized protein